MTNPQNYNRYNMRLFESVLLLILRILYDEKRRELSVSDEVIVNVGDIHEKFLSLKIRDKMIDKTTFRNAISTLKRFQIIETLDTNLTDEEARIIIFDAILKVCLYVVIARRILWKNIIDIVFVSEYNILNEIDTLNLKC